MNYIQGDVVVGGDRDSPVKKMAPLSSGYKKFDPDGRPYPTDRKPLFNDTMHLETEAFLNHKKTVEEEEDERRLLVEWEKKAVYRNGLVKSINLHLA